MEAPAAAIPIANAAYLDHRRDPAAPPTSRAKRARNGAPRREATMQVPDTFVAAIP